MKRTTFLTFSLTAAWALFTSVNQLPAALVAQYDFDGNVNDSSGNGYNGVVGGTTTYGAGLFSGQSFSFDGSTGVNVTGADASTLGLANNSLTVNSWINMSDFSVDRTILGSSGPGATNQNLHLIVRGSKAHMGFFANDTTGNQTLLVNQTYNVAYRYDQSIGEQAIFINGRLDAATPGHAAFQSPTATVSVGQGGCCGSPAVGSIDHVQIFNTAIRKGQLVEQYQTVSLAGTPTPATGFISDYLGGSTLNSLYYSVNNTTGQGGPAAVTAVGGTDGHVDLQSRGHLNTRGQFNPSATGVKITGRWTSTNAGGLDFFQVLTRSDGVPNVGSFGETTNGVEFFKQTGSSALSVTTKGSQFSVSGVTQTGTLNFVEGGAYDFAITDNGSQVTFKMVDVYDPSNTASVTATVTPTGPHENTDFITFHNREGGPRNARLETLKISSLTPTIGVLGTGPNPGFTVKGVQDGSISNLATADAALNSLTGVTIQAPVINFLESGANGNYGGDNASPVSGDNFALRATAQLWVPADAAGFYTFGTNNDDGVRLRIDGNAIITDDTGHGPTDFFGGVNLTAGLHTLELVFFDGAFGGEVELFYASGVHNLFNASTFSLLNIIVPEPSSAALLLIGLVGSRFARRRTRREE